MRRDSRWLGGGSTRRRGEKAKRVDIRTRIIALFVACVAVPSSLLGYLALRGVRNDQALFERDLRERLESEAVGALGSFRARLASLESLAALPEKLLEQEPVVDAIFALTPEGELGELVSARTVHGAAAGWWPPVAPLSGGVAARLADARRLELREGDLDGAAGEYAEALSMAATDPGRAEALNGLARVSRKLDQTALAEDHYRRLVTEFGSVSSGAGVPFALVGRLELVGIFEEIGSPHEVAAEVVALLEALLAHEHDLTAVEYRFVADRARRAGEALLTSPSSDVVRRWGDSLSVLLEREEVERRRTARVLAFVAAASNDPMLLAGLHQRVGGGASQSQMIMGDGGPFPVHLVAGAAPDVDRSSPQLGLLLDPSVLEQLATDVLRTASVSGAFDWILHDESGRLVSAGGDGRLVESPSGVPWVLVSFPERFPPLTLGLMPPSAGAVESFFSSPQSVYLYAFLLLAGTLAGGLALTVRTLTHQLELARMQSDFVSTVSHELKSPLTSIRQLAEMLQAGRVVSEDRRRRYLDVLVEQSERLTALIDHVLDFARFDAGHTKLDSGRVDLGSLVEEVVEGVQDRVRHRGFVVRSVVEPGLPLVDLDPEAIALATTNVIDNAIKFSGESREVIVRTSAENGHALIAVQDFGMGLDRSEQERVFERFYRGSEALSRTVKGTGLGLTLVKQIVEAHGGVVIVESEHGRGSTFTLRLPVSGP